MTLKQIFSNEVSSSAFQQIDGETIIQGKFGQIALMDDGITFDLWFVGPDLQPLTPQKLTAIRESVHVEGGLRMLDGEAYARTRSEAEVLQALSVMGVKRKRKYSEKTRQKLRARLAEMNQGAAMDVRKAA